jgi:hypothetical protein
MRPDLLSYITLQCLLLLSFGGLSAPVIADQKLSGERVNGLEMSIYLDQTDDGDVTIPKFRADLHNAGENDSVLNLGIMLANGERQYPEALLLMITDAAGKTRQFDLIVPGIMGGRADPLVIPLGAGATLSVPIDLHNYWAAKSFEFAYKLKAGKYVIEAQFTGTDASDNYSDMVGLGFMPYWKGTVSSNRLRFDVPK